MDEQPFSIDDPATSEALQRVRYQRGARRGTVQFPPGSANLLGGTSADHATRMAMRRGTVLQPSGPPNFAGDSSADSMRRMEGRQLELARSMQAQLDALTAQLKPLVDALPVLLEAARRSPSSAVIPRIQLIPTAASPSPGDPVIQPSMTMSEEHPNPDGVLTKHSSTHTIDRSPGGRSAQAPRTAYSSSANLFVNQTDDGAGNPGLHDIYDVASAGGGNGGDRRPKKKWRINTEVMVDGVGDETAGSGLRPSLSNHNLLSRSRRGSAASVSWAPANVVASQADGPFAPATPLPTKSGTGGAAAQWNSTTSSHLVPDTPSRGPRRHGQISHRTSLFSFSEMESEGVLSTSQIRPSPLQRMASMSFEQVKSTGGGDALNAGESIETEMRPLASTTKIDTGLGRSPRQASLYSVAKIGYNEDNIVISILDVLYILNAIACCVISISAINPRIDILNTIGLFYTATVIYIFSTVFTAIWIAMRFFVQSRRGDWEVVDRLTHIRGHYLRTWFAFDLIYGLPIEWIFVVWRWDVFYYLQMRCLLRIVRIVSLGNSGNPLREVRLWYRFVSFCAAYCLIIHTLASVFGAVEDKSYLDSLYWAVLTVTSVGYGDVVPVTPSGKIYTIFAMLTGIALISSMTAFATSFLTSKDKLREDLDEKKSLMNAMLAYYAVPWDVQRDVISMFPAVLESQSESAFRQMSEAMPPFVARKVDAYARAKLLRSVPLFKEVKDTDMVLELSQLMTRRFIPAQEYIVCAGDVGREMFFIMRGVVEVLVPAPDDPDEEVVIASLRSGQYFGEIALLEDVVHTASVQTVSLCELLVLEKEQLNRVANVREGLQALLRHEMGARRDQTQHVAAQLKQPMAPFMWHPHASAPNPLDVLQLPYDNTDGARPQPETAERLPPMVPTTPLPQNSPCPGPNQPEGGSFRQMSQGSAVHFLLPVSNVHAADKPADFSSAM
jgi:CRP-like cAMP-binding protein